MPNIISILPLREGFGPTHFGAIALCVKDFTEHSQYRDQTLILGGVDTPPFADMPFQRVQFQRRWPTSHNRAYANAIAPELNQLNPQLIEVHNRPILLHYLHKQWNGKLALHLHNDPQTMRAAKTALDRQKLLDKCAAIYCVSDYIRQRFLENVSRGAEKVHVVYNGLKKLPPAPKKKKHILFVGRFQPEKGALDIARALEHLLPEFPDWRGIFIGAAKHHPEARVNAYEMQVMNALKPVEAHIEMRGYCSHGETLQATMEAAIAVIPSQWNEAFGRTALEAMACGCATISSVRGGLKEVVEDAAYALHEVNPHTIENALREVIENTELRKTLQQQGLNQATHFEINQTTKSLDKIRSHLLTDIVDKTA